MDAFFFALFLRYSSLPMKHWFPIAPPLYSNTTDDVYKYGGTVFINNLLFVR